MFKKAANFKKGNIKNGTVLKKLNTLRIGIMTSDRERERE